MSESSTAPASATRDGLALASCERAVARGLDYLASQQEADGAWRGDYGGPMFLLPMYVAARHIGGRPIEPATARRHDRLSQREPEADGSFGLHVESSGCLFTTVLCYVAFRLLGLAADDERVARARAFIHAHGTALACASWGKFTLALLNLYEYDGLQPVLPELWLLPASLPFHPSRLWCHCRQVYLPMAHLYGMRARMPADDLTHALRRETLRSSLRQHPLRRSPQHHRPRRRLRADVHGAQGGQPRPGLYERVHPRGLRERALARLPITSSSRTAPPSSSASARSTPCSTR